jgi:hypothetical protein
MALNLPTTQQQVEQNLAVLETNVGQEAPIQEKALIRVLSVLFAMVQTTGYKYGVQQSKQNLALTADRDGLIDLGDEFGVPIKEAEAAQFTAELPATTGTVITTNIDYSGDSNGVRYNLDAQVVAAADIATLQLTAQTLGSAGNLLVGETLTIASQIPGILSTKATITVITNTGVDAEDTEDYRQRVLAKIRATPGGATSSDFRIWATAVAGVESAYPYSRRPDQVGGGNPGDRTVFIEADDDIDPDGIPPQSLLDEVKTELITDPVTGLARQPLGMVADTLFVLPIAVTSFFVIINGLSVSIDQEAQVKADIETELDNYFRSLDPYIEGLDPVESQNDLITDPTISAVIQDVVSAAGGTFSEVAFNIGAANLPSYQLGAGEHAKLGATPTYV